MELRRKRLLQLTLPSQPLSGSPHVPSYSNTGPLLWEQQSQIRMLLAGLQELAVGLRREVQVGSLLPDRQP